MSQYTSSPGLISVFLLQSQTVNHDSPTPEQTGRDSKNEALNNRKLDEQPQSPLNDKQPKSPSNDKIQETKLEEEDEEDIKLTRAWSAIGRRSPYGVRNAKSPTNDEEIDNKSPDIDNHDAVNERKSPVTQRAESKAETAAGVSGRPISRRSNSKPASPSNNTEESSSDRKPSPTHTGSKDSKPASPTTSRLGSTLDLTSPVVEAESEANKLPSGKTTPTTTKPVDQTSEEESKVFGDGEEDTTSKSADDNKADTEKMTEQKDERPGSSQVS